MSTDLIISLVIIGVSALILHLKSHLKFITFGLFIGIVLAEIVGVPAYNYLAPRVSWLARPAALNSLQLLFLLLPTLILGVNHLSDRKKMGLGKVLLFTAVTTFLLLASILKYLPEEWRLAVTGRSIIAFQLLQFQVGLLILGSLLVIADSFRGRKDKGKKSKSKI